MKDSANNVIGFHHVDLVVPDIDGAKTFYMALLDLELYSESSWDGDNSGFNQVVGLEQSSARLCMLKGSNGFLELFEYSSPTGTNAGQSQANDIGFRHLCVVVNDVDVALQRCIELGGSKMNDPYSVTGGATAVYCRDPYGNLLEMVSPAGRFPPPFMP